MKPFPHNATACLPTRCCACGCGVWFEPKQPSQVYASRACKGRTYWQRKREATRQALGLADERRCACGCGEWFLPLHIRHFYATKNCCGRVAMRRRYARDPARWRKQARLTNQKVRELRRERLATT
jgi:hypothetical protein